MANAERDRIVKLAIENAKVEEEKHKHPFTYMFGSDGSGAEGHVFGNTGGGASDLFKAIDQSVELPTELKAHT